MATSTSGGRPVIVYNPLKVDDLDTLERQAEAICTQHGWQTPDWLATTEEDHGSGMARRAVDEGADLVCVLGGDGTVREVATAMAHAKVPLGVLGSGTGNLLARNLGLPHNDFPAALTAVLEGSERRIDLGLVSFDEGPEMCFTVIIGMGLDAQTMVETESEVKKKIGWPAYVLGALGAMGQRGFNVETTVEDREPFTSRCRMVLACNCGRLPGGIDLVPEAEIDDGKLDIMTFAPRGVLGWAAATARAVTIGRRGRLLIRHDAGHTCVVTAAQPVEAEVDGDPVGAATTMRIRADEGALLVRA